MFASRLNSSNYSDGPAACPERAKGVEWALALLRVYKIILSPLFAGSCRYVPSCSEYMSESIARHGVMRGGWIGTRRLCRCHPFGGHGYDPVPVAPEARSPKPVA